MYISASFAFWISRRISSLLPDRRAGDVPAYFGQGLLLLRHGAGGSPAPAL